MKKIFTLLTLLCAVGGAWADDVTVSWGLGGSTDATVTPAVAGTAAYTVGSGLTEDGTYTFSGVKFIKFNQNTGSEKGDNNHNSGVTLKKYVDITFTPEGGSFQPTKVSFDMVRGGTGDPNVFVDVIDGAGKTIAVADNKAIRRNNDSEDVSISHAYSVEGAASSDKAMTLRIIVGKLASGKYVGLANVVIEGTFLKSGSPVLTAANAYILASTSGEAATASVDVTGENLTGSTLAATLSPAVEGLSVSLASSTITSGAINTKAILSYTATANAKGSTTLTLSDGTTSKSVTVNYEALVTPNALASISAATTWDWTSWAETIELTDASKPTKSDEYTFSDIAVLTGLTLPKGFDGTALTFKGQFPVRSKKSQNGTWKFHTTVPGSITVTFSDTGSNGDNPAKRYLNVNGVNTEYYTQRNGTSDEKTETVDNLPAGDIVITGKGEDGTTNQAIVVTKIVFTPATSLGVKIADSGYSSFATTVALDLSGVDGLKAYQVTSVTQTTVTLTQVTGTVAAKTGLILQGTAGQTYNIPVAETGTDISGTNLLVGVTEAKAIAGDFVLKGGQFVKASDAGNLAAGKAYLPAAAVPASTAELTLDFGAGTTGINVVVAAEGVKNAEVYNLAGQRVSQPTKGLYIVGGKKVVIK